jgi:hypothetical protein
VLAARTAEGCAPIKKPRAERIRVEIFIRERRFAKDDAQRLSRAALSEDYERKKSPAPFAVGPDFLNTTTRTQTNLTARLTAYQNWPHTDCPPNAKLSDVWKMSTKVRYIFWS